MRLRLALRGSSSAVSAVSIALLGVVARADATYNVSQDFLGPSVSKPPLANPGIILNVDKPVFSTPVPFVVGTMPSATGALTVTYSDGAGSVYQAAPSSDFSLTVTAYAEGVLSGTFGGTLAQLAGPGPASLSVSDGAFRAELTIVGQ